MKSKQFLSHLQHEQIVKAIKEAQSKTTGQIHVFVSHRKAPNALAAAQREFQLQHLDQHPAGNVILIFIAPLSHTFAVIGGKAIHEKCGDAFWETLAAEMAPHFKSGKFHNAVLHAVNQAGEVLATHFPIA